MTYAGFSGRLHRWVLLWSVLLPLCSTSAGAEEVINIGGSGTGLGPIKLIAQAYEQTHRGVTIRLFPSLGSSGGIKAALQGALHIAVTGRSLKEEERALGAVEIELARTPFVFVTHPNVSFSNVSDRELRDIYTGAMNVWPDGMRIRPVLRPETDTDTTIIKSISSEMAAALKAALSREGMIFKVTDQESSEEIQKIPGAFGATTMTQIITEKLRLNVLSYQGVRPSLPALADGSYPLYKKIFLVTVPGTTAEAHQFAEFVRSRTGREILTRSGNLTVAR